MKRWRRKGIGRQKPLEISKLTLFLGDVVPVEVFEELYDLATRACWDGAGPFAGPGERQAAWGEWGGQLIEALARYGHDPARIGGVIEFGFPGP